MMVECSKNTYNHSSKHDQLIINDYSNKKS